MNTEKLFELATRGKFRFPYKGLISVEDLWDLSKENLDSIYKSLNTQAKQSKEESLLNTKSKDDEILDAKIEIIKYIVTVKVEEETKRLAAKAMKEEKQKIMAIISEKKDQSLQSKSIEELEAMLGGLNA